MTIEEKAKAYEEALDRAKEFHKSKEGIYVLVAETIFPELRESEKPLTPFQQCLNLILHKVYFASIPNTEDINKFILDIVKNHTGELVELAKKHEYTDYQLRESEDERIIEEIKFAVMQMPSERQDTKNRCRAWLEKQKEQKPAEWSEEDEDMLNSCISSIEEAKETRYAYKETDGDTSYDHEIAWLKSLRNRVGKESLQPHWKPSEEQMKALLKAVDKARELHYTSIDGYPGYNDLRSLYEQLKKLM